MQAALGEEAPRQGDLSGRPLEGRLRPRSGDPLAFPIVSSWPLFDGRYEAKPASSDIAWQAAASPITDVLGIRLGASPETVWVGYCASPAFPLIFTTSAGFFTPAASRIAAVATFTDCRTGSRSSRGVDRPGLMALVVQALPNDREGCPSLGLPASKGPSQIMDAQIGQPARCSTRAAPFFGSTKCPCSAYTGEDVPYRLLSGVFPTESNAIASEESVTFWEDRRSLYEECATAPRTDSLLPNASPGRWRDVPPSAAQSADSR